MNKKTFLSINIQSHYKTTLFIYVAYISNQFKNLNLTFTQNFLPKKRKKKTILKSTHVYKKAKDQYEIIRYKVILNVQEKLSINFIQLLLKNKPKNIDISIKQFTYR